MRVKAGRPEPVSMEEAVGYGAVDCSHASAVDSKLVLKHDRLFLLVDPHGDITPPGICGLGLFHDDTRILSHYALRFAGGPPALLSRQVPRMYGAVVDLAVSDMEFGGNAWDPKNAIHIRRELLLDERFVERVTLANYLLAPLEYWLELHVGCDFADIFEVRGWRREERGQFFAPEVDGDRLRFSYRGRDGTMVGSRIRFREPPSEVHPAGARWRIRLEPNAVRTLEWTVAAEVGGTPSVRVRRTLETSREPLAALYRDWRAECARWETDLAEFNSTLDRSVDDLRALYVEIDGETVISAGIPWYSTVFGRDSLITSLQTLPVSPRIAVDTLRYLARHQGEEVDPFTEEQPGRVMHELRRGEMARAGEIPHVPYYGTIDATPLWLVLLHETWRWTGDTELVRELLPNAERALAWIDEHGDLDGDGFVEYESTSAKGLVNQGWKDSGDGVPFPDGRLPRPPVALVEVQGYVYDAKTRMASIFEALGQSDRAVALRRDAAALRERIVEHFWLEDAGTFALALDGDKRPIPTATSNAGHLLWSRVPDARQAARMADHLLGSEMFSGWGIRTLSAAHRVFNPMSYHNGSIWPHDNALVVMGLSFYGHTRKALPVVAGMHDAAFNMPLHRLPELFCGIERSYGNTPVLYPVSCSPQAWASGAFFMFLQAVTGILPDAPDGVLHVREPQLPHFLQSLTVGRLRVGGSRVSLQFQRSRQRTLATLLRVEGEPLQVRIELS